MAALLARRYGVKPTLIPSKGGVFEVKHNDELIFSKKALGRFPMDDEVFGAIDAQGG